MSGASPAIVAACIIGAVAVQEYAATRKERLARDNAEAVRSAWASERPTTEFHARKTFLATRTLFAAVLFALSSGVAALMLANSSAGPLLTVAAIVPFALGAAVGLIISTRNMLRVWRYGNGIRRSSPALRLDENGVQHFDLFSVPWSDIVDTRDLEIHLGRGRPREYITLFVKKRASVYLCGGWLNRFEMQWTGRSMGMFLRGTWPPPVSENFLTIDVDALSKAYAPRLRVWVDVLRKTHSSVLSQ